MHLVYTTKQYAHLYLSGIVNTDSTIVAAGLNQIFEFKHPYKIAEVDPCTNMFLAGKDVSINLILSNLVNGIVKSKLLDITPWRITFKRAPLLIPKVAIAEIPIT